MNKGRAGANAERDKVRAEALKKEAEILARVREATAKSIEEGRKQMQTEVAEARTALQRDVNGIAEGPRVARARPRGARMMKNVSKRVALVTLLCAVGAGVPAIAHAVQREPGTHVHEHAAAAQAPAEEGAEQSKKELSGSDEGEDHPPAPINFWDLSNKEQPAYGYMFLNFAILMAAYVALGKKPVAEALKNRRASIAKEIEAAQRMRDEAEARAKKYQDKLQHLEGELSSCARRSRRRARRSASASSARPRRRRRVSRRTRSSSSSRR